VALYHFVENRLAERHFVIWPKDGVTRLGEIPTFWLNWDTFKITNFQIHNQFQQMVFFVDILSFQKWIDVNVLGFQIKV
jgi:hypothetical protein